MEVVNFVIAVGLLLLSYAYWHVKKSFSYWKSYNVPHNKPSFPFGNSKVSGKTLSFRQLLSSHYSQFSGTANKLCGFYYFTQPMALLLDLDLIKQILVTDFSVFSDRYFYYNDKDDPLSGNLFLVDGEKWRHLRTKLSPTFSSGKIKYMFTTMAKLGDRLNDHLHKVVVGGKKLDVKDIASRFTMDVIGTCAFGIECNALEDTNGDFYRFGRMALEKPRHSLRVELLMTNMKTLARFFRMKTIRDDVSAFFLNVVRSTIDHREQNNVERSDFMDLLIKLKNEDDASDTSKGLTVNQIAAQAYIFFIAGYETSATTMLFTLYELALNEDIQIKLRREIQKSFQKHGEFSYEMVMDIPFLDQVINETLRKYPPTITLRRVTQKDYTVPDTDIVIKKGVPVAVNVYRIHHDPKYYPDPDKYDPDRFSPEEIKKRHTMAWLPFGGGPRHCIALRFAMMETRVGLISLLRSFKFSPCGDTPVPMVFATSSPILSPKDCIYLKIDHVID